MEQKCALLCRGIQKSFGEGSLQTQVLSGIDLSVNLGEFVILAGPSGSGKSTLLSILAGILSYDAGSCQLFGQEIGSLSETKKTKLRRDHLGFVFQSFNLIPMLTALENTMIPLLLNQKKKQEATELARKRLIALGLGERLSSRPTTLSGGEQQRVAIARAVIHNPSVILCDEPTSALDHQNGLSVLKLLREIVNQENRAIILVTHDKRHFEFADRIVKMEDGRIIGEEIGPYLEPND